MIGYPLTIEILTYSPNQEYIEKITHMRIVIILNISIVYASGDFSP